MLEVFAWNSIMAKIVDINLIITVTNLLDSLSNSLALPVATSKDFDSWLIGLKQQKTRDA